MSVTTAELAIWADADDATVLLQAQAQVRGYCRWHIAPERTETFILDGSGSGTLLLPTLHLSAVTACNDDGTDLDVATLEWSRAGIIRRGDCYWWTDKFRGVTVTATHGYPDVPPDVTAVVQAFANRAASLPAGITSRTVGPFSESYAPAFLETERMVLDRYRLPLVS